MTKIKIFRVSKILCILQLCLSAALSSILFCSVPAYCAANDAALENAPKFTEEEQAFIDRTDEISIGCPVDNCPVLFSDEKTGEIKGITVDILENVARNTGLKFRYVKLNSGSVTYKDLQELQVDLIASVEFNSENQNSVGIIMTDPYLQTEKVFVCKRGVVFDRNSEMTVAAASGSQTLARVIEGIYPHFHVVFYDSTEEALQAVIKGEADTVLQNQYSLERILARPQYDNLRIVSTASIGDSQCLAALVPITEDRQNVVEEDTSLLLSVLNKGISCLNPDDVTFIIIKETAENAYRMTNMDMLYLYRYSIVIICIGLFIILILLARIGRLQRKRVEQRVTEKKAQELSELNQQLQKQEVLLKDALVKAEAGSRAKSSFLFNMSHDIRTPMNAILGFTSIAIKQQDNPVRVADCLSKIEKSGEHLLHLINDILDMSRIESGKVTLSRDACNLIEVIGQVKDTMQPEITKKKLRFHVNCQNVVTQNVYCDSLRVNQILLNLVSNAAKFSKPGGNVTLSLIENPSDITGYASYEFHVKDDGIGMSEEFQEHLFEPFEREKSSTVSGTQGTGLGLSITKSLVDLMNGTIDVISAPDEGTEFILHFVFKKQGDEPGAEPLKPSAPESLFLTGKHILLAEDNLLNAEIAEEILTEHGLRIDTVSNGQLALKKIESCPSGYYDAILMDIQMPVMDGYEATRRIRKLDDPIRANIPIIAMTANAFEEDRREAIANGMNAHIAKPIDVSLLLTTLAELLKQ